MAQSRKRKHKAIPHTCHDCGVREGEFHQLGCDMEPCPFCGGQLISCDCPYQQLGLLDRNKYDKTTAFLPPDIYHQGLSEKQEARWLALLEVKGRVPYILYPIVCAKCGTLWPELFMVPDAEWEHYIQIDMRREVICQSCYDYIKRVIDARS